MMKSTGQAGQPESYFRRQSITGHANRLNVSIGVDTDGPVIDEAYLAAVRQEGTGDTCCFGLRLMWESLEDMSSSLERCYPSLPDYVARFDSIFGKTTYIHLSRTDKVSQAVSLLKAEQSGLWHVGIDGTEIERTKPNCTPVYDKEHIAEYVVKLKLQDAGWIKWFNQNRINPIRITYETLAESPSAAFADILSELGLDRDLAANVEPETAVLADEVSKQWVSRYKTEI